MQVAADFRYVLVVVLLLKSWPSFVIVTAEPDLIALQTEQWIDFEPAVVQVAAVSTV